MIEFRVYDVGLNRMADCKAWIAGPDADALEQEILASLKPSWCIMHGITTLTWWEYVELKNELRDPHLPVGNHGNCEIGRWYRANTLPTTELWRKSGQYSDR